MDLVGTGVAVRGSPEAWATQGAPRGRKRKNYPKKIGASHHVHERRTFPLGARWRTMRCDRNRSFPDMCRVRVLGGAYGRGVGPEVPWRLVRGALELRVLFCNRTFLLHQYY